MKIARLVKENMETYGFVNEGKVLTRESIATQTGIPIPQSIKDFLFDGWYDEIKQKALSLTMIIKYQILNFCLPFQIHQK